MGRKTEKHKTPFVKFYEDEMADRPLSVRVRADIDKYVRSLPNRTEWLRQAIAAQVERDKQLAVVNSGDEIEKGDRLT